MEKHGSKYMELMDVLLEKGALLPENASNDAVFTFLKENRALIKELAMYARQTGIFERAQEDVIAFKKKLKQGNNTSAIKENVVSAYIWVLDRIVNAPTRLHMQCSVALCMPIVDDAFMDNAEDVR